jgi:anti-anti-sigma factor
MSSSLATPSQRVRVHYLEVIVEYDSDHAVLLVTGEEDRTTSARRRRAMSAALRASRDVCVDLSQLRFADPSLMLDLAVLAQRLRSAGLRVRLRGAQPQIMRLIELVGLDRQPAVALELA